MKKKMASILLSLLCVVTLFGCKKADSESAQEQVDSEVTDEQKEEILVKLTKQIQDSYTSGETTVELVQNDDGTYAVVTTTAGESTEVTAPSIDELYQVYVDQGVLDNEGNIYGFYVAAENAATSPESEASVNELSQSQVEEILENTEVEGERETMAGMPGEGQVYAGVADGTPTLG